MRHMGYQEACIMLRKAGFTEAEIERLSKLRAAHTEEEIHPTPDAQQSPLRRSWLERVVRKIPDICWRLADNGSIFWSHDRFIF